VNASAGEQAIAAARVAEIEEALALYGLRLAAPPRAVANSTRNENYRAMTDDGPRFVRFHRPNRSLSRLRREHRAIVWADQQGIPVALPLRSRDGDTVNEVRGRLVAVFRWIAGRPANRGRVSIAQAAAIGDMHGRLHKVLARYEDNDLPWFWSTWEQNTIESAEKLTQYVQRLPSLDLNPDDQTIIRACLETQIEHLRVVQPMKAPLFDSPWVQPVHGDYHERNVLFNETDQLVGVVDWDMVTHMPRAFEVVRCLTFAALLSPSLLDAYMAAYRVHSRLTAEECSDAVELWWQYNLRDTWLAKTRLDEQDAAVQPFFAEHLEFMAQCSDSRFRSRVAEVLCGSERL
jgi:Ser/Thr protein kinase RdoA (MazF antagonist)